MKSIAFVADQMRQIDKFGSIIFEPAGRNTAPALALAALLSDEDDIVRFEDLYG